MGGNCLSLKQPNRPWMNNTLAGRWSQGGEWRVGAERVGAGEVREGEARGSARHQVSNTTPKPPYPLTPHPLHLDPYSGGYHHPVITPTPPFYMAHSKLSHQHLVLGFWPKPHPQPHVCECAASPSSLCPLPIPTTSQYHHHLFTQHTCNGATTARFRVFYPNPPPPAWHCWMHSPPTTTIPLTRTHHLPVPPPTGILHGNILSSG